MKTLEDRKQAMIDKIINPPVQMADCSIHFKVMRNAVLIMTEDDIAVYQSNYKTRGFRRCPETQPRMFHVTKRYTQLRAKVWGVHSL